MAGKKENPTLTAINTINEHIKTGSFSKLYVLTGTEGYFVSQYKHALLEALVTPGDTMNYNVFAGDKVNAVELIEAINTMPFFSDHRTILAEGTGLLKKVPEELIDNFISTLENIPDTTRLIFVESEVDARTRIYKAVSKIGTVAKFETPDSSMLNAWVKKVLSEDGAAVEDKAVFALINAVGQDMNRLSNEAAKLRAYAADKGNITVADVDLVCENEAENKVFAMLDAIAAHDSEKALLLYSDLEQLKTPPMQTLALIRKRFMQLSQLKVMQKDKEENSVMAKYTGIHPFYLKDTLKQANCFTIEELLSASELCADAELDIKAGRLTDKNAVEMLILHLCLKKTKG